MKRNIPRTPFSTFLTGPAKETERRIRNIFQGRRKRPDVLALAAAILATLLCGSLVSCQMEEPSGGSSLPLPGGVQPSLTNGQPAENSAMSERPRRTDEFVGYFSADLRSRSELLSDYGFQADAPFYAYYDGENLQLELYYDTQAGTGCGFRYVQYEPDGPVVIHAFALRAPEDKQKKLAQGYLTDVWGNTAPYSVEPVFDTHPSEWEGILDYQESMTYDSDGKLETCRATGVIPEGPFGDERADIFHFTFAYREDGSLRSKEYGHNFLFGTTYSSSSLLYDEAERLSYARSYITHGELEFYYIYEEDGPWPAYCFCLDHNTSLYEGGLIRYSDSPAEQTARFS